MYYTIYKVTNKLNGKYYIGKHQTKNLNDGYMGSGISIKQAIQKYGIENFIKEILHVFQTEEEMNAKEKELVVISEDSYNLCEGGKGGFGYINRSEMNKGKNNVMNRNIEAKNKCIQNGKITRSKNPEFYANIARVNGMKAREKCLGVKCPSKGSSSRSKKLWSENYEKMRDCLSSYFEVIDPIGKIYLTNRLQDFCIIRNLTYTSLWNTSRTKKPVKKGKSKGWICKIIQH